MKLHAILLSCLIAGCSARDHGTDSNSLQCGSPMVCTYIQVRGDRVYLGITNETNELVYVPWVTGIRTPASAFNIVSQGADKVRTLKGSNSPTKLLDGRMLLVPYASYVISITKEQAKEIYDLKAGCQSVNVEFRITQAPGFQGVAYASIAPTKICL